MSSLRFGDFEIDTDQRQLLRSGEVQKLGGRGFDLLRVLIERRDRMLSKNELLDLVWPGLVVEENNLQVQVAALRKLIGPQAITTVPGRGYRFALPVDEPAASPVAAPATQPAPATSANNIQPPSNLPVRQLELFGRTDELQALRALMAAHPLVTIVGAGGIGKTRLALAAAAQLRDEFPDGVWWVELAALSEPQMAPNAIAQVLGVSGSSAVPVADALVSRLGDQRLLLVLDNAEHLLDAVAAIIDILRQACPEVRFLVTSQEPTRLPDEHAFRLTGLPVPAVDAPVDPHNGAVALFGARAQAADRLFRFNDDTLPAVAAICRALDGIPLAIELAAARVPLLGIEGVRDRLHQRLNLLTGGNRTILRRHQTLRAALEWSHGLLTDDERIVFRRLAVFAGGFSLPLAQAVAADERIDAWTVLDLLGHLVDKSLVVVVALDPKSEPRYRLLETARAYGLEQLAAAGETSEWLRRHAQALYEFLLELYPARWSHDDATGDRASVELDNLRAALDWAAAPGGDPTLGHALHGVSFSAWSRERLQLEGLERYLRLPSTPLPPEVEARAQLAHARLGQLGARQDCFRAAERAAALFERLGNDIDRVDALSTLVILGSLRNERDAVAAAMQTIERLVQPHWPRRLRAAIALSQAMQCQMLGDAAGAIAAAWRQYGCFPEDGDEEDSRFSRLGRLYAEGNVALYESFAGDHDVAVARHERVNDGMAKLLGPVKSRGGNGVFLASALVRRNGPGDLRRGIETARDHWRMMRRNQESSDWLVMLALAQARRGAVGNAIRLLGYADARLAIGEWVLFSWYQRDREEVCQLRDQVGAAQFDAWYAAGQQLDDRTFFKIAFEVD